MRSPQPMTLPALSFQHTILPLDWARAVPATNAASAVASAAARNAREFLGMGRDSILFAVAADRGQMLRVPRLGPEKSDQVIQRGDADHRNIITGPDFLHRGQRPAAALHAVECDRHATGYSV